MYGKQRVDSIVSNKHMAPAMIVRGVSASCTPLMTLPLTKIGSDPRYINRMKNISNALNGNDLVVDNGFKPHGGIVAIIKLYIYICCHGHKLFT